MTGATSYARARPPTQRSVSKLRAVRRKESAVAREHVLAPRTLLVQPTPAALDPTGAWFVVRKASARRHGRRGFADAWKRGSFAREYKGEHGDLEAA